jgi:hypothetical protein
MPDVDTTQTYGNLIGDMYARWTLDCVIEIAHAVSVDYVARPEFYRGSDVPDNIVDLRTSYGYVRNYPNKAQRSDLNAPVLATSDGYTPPKGGPIVVDKFRQYREPLFKACIAYTERSVVDAASGLKEGVIQAMRYFPQYLRNFEGDSLSSTYKQLRSVSELSFKILTSSTVSGAFGVAPPPKATWPLEIDDQKGSQLINVISDTLQLKDIGLNQEKFTKLRAIAQEGGEALEAALLTDPISDPHFEALVAKVYSWAKSLEYYSTAGTPQTK